MPQLSFPWKTVRLAYCWKDQLRSDHCGLKLSGPKASHTQIMVILGENGPEPCLVFQQSHKDFPVGMAQTLLQREIAKEKHVRNTTGEFVFQVQIIQLKKYQPSERSLHEHFTVNILHSCSEEPERNK